MRPPGFCTARLPGLPFTRLRRVPAPSRAWCSHSLRGCVPLSLQSLDSNRSQQVAPGPRLLTAPLFSLVTTPELSTPSRGKPDSLLCCPTHHTLNQEGNGVGGPLGHEKCRWGRGRPPAAGPGGAYAGQMVRPQHMPPAQLLGALPAASREGHVCIAGPGPCAGPLWAGWERVQGKAWPCWAGEGRGQSCGPRPPPQNLLVHRLCSPSGHLVRVQICADFLSPREA